MSVVRKEGKDTIIFATKEDHASPSKVHLPEPEPSPGLILPNGEINWNCPCLGGMATGPCGLEFREAFSCFHYSTAEPKGSDCYDAFKTMQNCMSEYPALYGDKEADLDNLDNEDSPDSADRNTGLTSHTGKEVETQGSEAKEIEESKSDISSSKKEIQQSRAQ